ncbi:E3 ubiquitin-protein ligase TRIM39-like [Salarias fasciatus]|uniref:E3 ubiquitin-protein ligase TRIM39-like n=1 Tax=Salarias fasciatus TaxID=181472 RepID=A0A672H9M7_SALFA|nr:E3 ubiquitin-protein ligase TRIM39-like [Salarias fasciatus]
MSAASNLLSEDQFLCSICLEVFTDPVSTPCGHNFCNQCITQHWNTNSICDCPLCKKQFRTRPELNVNTFISEMVSQFRREAELKASSSSEQQAAKPGEVPCDVCTGTKVKALKSCLVCLVSYCQTHLEPHLTVSVLKKHQLMEPVENLEGRMCLKHHKPLELFCQREQTCVCMMCSVLEHRKHKVVPLSEEAKRKKKELRKTEAEMQQMIQERRVKIKEIRECVKRSKAAADREKAEGVEVFTALKECVERGLKQLMERMEEEEEAREKQAEGLIRDLEEEICELIKRSSEVKQLFLSEDHLHLLQDFSSLKAAPPTKDWTEVSVRPSSYEGTVVRAVAQLEETLSKEMKKKLVEAEIKKLFEADLKRKQQFAMDVTLDPDTAHPDLILSDDGKQVSHGDVRKKLPDNPERFNYCVNVLGKQSFSSGKFYFEVQVKGKTEWILGVSNESINRKGEIRLSPDEGLWIIGLENQNKYFSCENHTDVDLSLKCVPEKVGVFVDYEEGLVYFYDVAAAAPIYSFTGYCFTDKLLPFFCPGLHDGGKNSAPLIICPVNQTV